MIDKLSYYCCDHLAKAVVERAIMDWRLLIEQGVKKENDKRMCASYDEIRRFFKSTHCEMLMSGMQIKPCDILSILEKEREEAGL